MMIGLGYRSHMSSIACPLCGVLDVDEWFNLERGVIYRCSSAGCGLGFLGVQPTDDELAGYYDEYYYPDHGSGAVFENSTVSKMEQHFSALDERVGLRGKAVLDYGCGVGNFLEVASRSGAEPVGLEYDDVARREAEAKGFRVAKTIDELEPGTFDFVYMNDVIEHLRDPVTDLREIRLRLKPNGVLFVVTMNMRGLKPRLRGKKWDVVTNPTHLWFYDETSLTATLRRSGYDDIEVQRWPVHFDHHGGARRLLQTALQRRGLDASLRMVVRPGNS
jgi:SAM-dependent methyltransferase